MPTVSEFFGILIRMYYDDHSPPHFHVYYGEYEAMVSIETLDVIGGMLPKRCYTLVLEWASEYKSELYNNWKLAELHEPLNKIEPLE